jgi:hypothetical protein
VKVARNVAIVAVLAGIVVAVPGAGTVANLFVWLVGVLFLGAIAWFAYVTYREHRSELDALGERMRAVLYASAAVAVLAITATPRLFNTGPGTLLWFALMGGAVYGVYAVWRSSREY